MDKFIRRENLKHYQTLLLRTTDESERRRIINLIEEERKIGIVPPGGDG